ncbi:MAG: Ig-like domain-containing protein [Defluviitaleaceae bacterium]|nr:Ig-like domain-containing protein [Defluviitaleaceae bacterium]
MSLPHFPDMPENFTYDKSISQILTSIAMEELGLSHIINAEGEKLQYILGTLESKPPVSPTIEQVLEVNQNVKDTLQQVAFNQMFLSAKMSDALKAYLQFKKIEQEENSHTDEDGTNVRPPTDPDKRISLPQPNRYRSVKKGEYVDIFSSAIRDFESSDTDIITGTKEDDQVRVHAINAGTAVMGIGNQIGVMTVHNFQVYDPEKISEYVLKNGGKIFFDGAGKTKPCPVTTTPASALNGISWTSLNPAIVEVTQNGDIKSIKKGAAVVVGTFTDTWGVHREIIILAGVAVQI